MTKNSIIGFHHFNIKAQNFDLTMNFYKALGFEEVHSWSLPGFNIEKCSMMFHPAANVYLEICDRNANMPTQGRKKTDEETYVESAILHICFTVKDAKQTYLFAIEKGAKPLIEANSIELIDPKKEKTIIVKNSLVYSPNGEVIEFIEDTFGLQRKI